MSDDLVLYGLIVTHWDGHSVNCPVCDRSMRAGYSFAQFKDSALPERHCYRCTYCPEVGLYLAKGSSHIPSRYTHHPVGYVRSYPHFVSRLPHLLEDFKRWKLIDHVTYLNHECVIGRISRSDRDLKVEEALDVARSWKLQLTRKELLCYRLLMLLPFPFEAKLRWWANYLRKNYPYEPRDGRVYKEEK